MDPRPNLFVSLFRRTAVRAACALCLVVAGGCQSPRGDFAKPSSGLDSNLRGQLDRANRTIAQLESENKKARDDEGKLAQQLRGQGEVQQILEQRLENMRRENDRLTEEVAGLVLHAGGDRSAAKGMLQAVSGTAPSGFDLPKTVENALTDFANRHPGVAYDRGKRVCRVPSELLFVEGGDQVRSDAQPLLKQLASLLDSEPAAPLNLLIVGHTSALAPIRQDLLKLHPTDWHLAAHQAIAVQQALEEDGVSPTRVGIISYASHQPLVDGADEVARKKNERVEIFLLPPEISSE